MSREITLQKLKLMFHEYYASNPDSLQPPHQVHMREFALQTWERSWNCSRGTRRDEDNNTLLDKSGNPVTGCGAYGTTFSLLDVCPKCGTVGLSFNQWLRHLSFRTRDELLNMLITKAPHSVYHSAALYISPSSKSMAKKERQGVELIFDIDADHIDRPCAKEHDTWACKGEDEDGKPCTEQGTGPPPVECKKCKGSDFEVRTWVCEKCLETAKKHTKRLFDDFLVSDFNIDPEKIQINYSGHRGYHVRVYDSNLYQLGSDARIEMVKYIMGTGIKAEKAIITRRGVNLIPDRDTPGWHGKIADSLIEFISNIDDYEGKERWRKKIQDNKTEILKGLQRKRPILTRGIRGLGPKTWKDIAMVAVRRYGSEVDMPVTQDLQRIIRFIGSLNGKTGLLVTEVTRDQLDSYSPFTEAIVFKKGTLRVKFPPGRESPRFTIDDTEYGPYSDESVELPTAAAVFALCKGVAVFE